jgi:hypothetical protein
MGGGGGGEGSTDSAPKKSSTDIASFCAVFYIMGIRSAWADR